MPTADNFPFGPADFSALSDRDIQNVLGDVKQENPGVGYESASAVATSAAAAATAPIAVTTAAAATSPTTSDFYPAYQTNAALFQAAANPYLQERVGYVCLVVCLKKNIPDNRICILSA